MRYGADPGGHSRLSVDDAKDDARPARDVGRSAGGVGEPDAPCGELAGVLDRHQVPIPDAERIDANGHSQSRQCLLGHPARVTRGHREVNGPRGRIDEHRSLSSSAVLLQDLVHRASGPHLKATSDEILRIDRHVVGVLAHERLGRSQRLCEANDAR